MKIIIPILSFGRSGGYRVITNLANSWIEAGHRVIILVPAFSEEPYFPCEAEIKWLDAEGVDQLSPAKDEISGSRRVFQTFQILRRGVEVFGQDADFILANHSITAWPVRFSRVKAKKLYYIQAYEPEYYMQRRGLSSIVLALLSMITYLFPFTRIVNSDIYFNYKLISSQHEVPPGVDFKTFYPNSLEKEFLPVIGCIGRIEPEKGTKYVVEAFRQLRDKGYSAELHIAYGFYDGELPLGASVVVPQNDDDLADYYRSLDILVAPGTLQLGAHHYPVLESLACGVPVITTGYNPVLPGAENGWIVPVKNSEAICEAIIEIISDPTIKDQRVNKGLQDIQRFGWEAVSSKFIHIANQTST